MIVSLAALGCLAAPAVAQEPQLTSDPGYGLIWDFVPSGTAGELKYATLHNPGSVDNRIERVEAIGRNDDDFVKVSDDCTGVTLKPGASCRVGVRFQPTEGEGTRVAHMKVTDSTPCAHWIELAGSATRVERAPRARAAACDPPRTTNVTNVTNQASSLQPAPREVVAFPRKCSSRRVIRIRVFAPRGAKLRSVRATLNRKPLKVRKVNGLFRATIDLRGRPRGANVVRLWLTASNGKRYYGKRVYRTCGAPRAIGTPRY